MSTVETVVSPWSSTPADRPAAARRARATGRPPAPVPTSVLDGGAPAERAARMRVGVASPRQIVDSAVAEAEVDAIRRALVTTHGNKSQAARLLRTNYTTLHA